jgi:hypothetical protein
MALPTTLAEWLALAVETREMALRMTNADARATMLDVAAGYEKLAEYMAARNPGPPTEQPYVDQAAPGRALPLRTVWPNHSCAPVSTADRDAAGQHNQQRRSRPSRAVAAWLSPRARM